VARPQTPEGKRVTFSVKLSEDDARAYDARCAALGWTRSEWLQHLMASDVADAPALAESLPEP